VDVDRAGNVAGNGDRTLANSIVYGPVPSRRLGRSLGINNIPPKICSYSCVYCQLGKTLMTEVEPRPFYKTAKIVEKVRAKLKQAREKEQLIDYMTFVPDGEPTLDTNLGEEIDILKGLGVRIAVITNGSLLWREDIRKNLLKADWLSLKIDAVDEETWCRIDRPHKSLMLDKILQGMLKFAKSFQGELTTETTLIKNVNDDIGRVIQVADFLKRLKPDIAYLAIPTRPPAERVEPATEQVINTSYQIYKERLSNVEYLIGYEGNAFASTGNAVEDLFSITAVHPMREDAVAEFLENAGADWGIIQKLIDSGNLIGLDYQGKKFYMRKLPGVVSRDSFRLSQND
jgi:wyosine [tRNA(Phe)-imidazoG37] synthetase (radical SAM superfamily)